ncbi:MAG: hypothetical protein RLZZ65_1422 [Bacteroidota bacterium]|jgi:hypothetical protein
MKALLLIFFVGIGYSVLAQEPNSNAQFSQDSSKFLIVRNNGIEYVGIILSDDGREILLETHTLGKIYIPKSDVKSISKVDAVSDFKAGEFLGQGIFTTRYQFTTNSFPIEKGDNYALVNLYGPEVHLSVAKNFSVGVMATWIASPIALAFKYTLPTQNPKLNFGFGTLLGSSGYFNQGKGYGGLHWAMATYGTRRSNATFSLGYAYFNSAFNFNSNNTYYTPGTYAAVLQNGIYSFPQPELQSYQNEVGNFKSPVIGFAGITPVGKKASFIWDCMIITGSTRKVFDNQDVQYFYDPNTGQPSYVVYGDPFVNVKSTNTILMPGMRFQKDQHRAFQVTLAGVIGKRTIQNSTTTTVNRYSFPVPMLSWFYKF